VSAGRAAPGPLDQGDALLAIYDRGLDEVYGYLLARCGGSPQVAEDLCSETFVAAADAAARSAIPDVSVRWLIGVARHKLADHWRRAAREERRLRLVGDATDDSHDPWDAHLDSARALTVLEQLGPHHRAALTFRYLDDLPVPDVAEVLGRTVHATEALLVRARAAFRRAYLDTEEVSG
jgi:RNA polymerase sigma-70 factor (ECF subfamily)